jgi:hypothetical protein
MKVARVLTCVSANHQKTRDSLGATLKGAMTVRVHVSTTQTNVGIRDPPVHVNRKPAERARGFHWKASPKRSDLIMRLSAGRTGALTQH